MAAHQDAALLAFVFMEITGAFAWLGLWQYRRMAKAAGWNISAILLLSVVTFALMARAQTSAARFGIPRDIDGAGGCDCR